MAKLETASSKSRNRVGDLLAILILLAVVAGIGWLWWKEKHHAKTGHQPTASVSQPSAQKPQPGQVVPSLVLVNRQPEPPADNAADPAMPQSTAPASANSNSSFSSNAVPVGTPDFPRPARTLLEAQIALARLAISPGSIDGAIGSQTRAAIAVFQQLKNLTLTRTLDTNTESALSLSAPLLVDYMVTSNDVARLQPLGKTWLAKSQQSALDYETILQLVAEKAHSHPVLIQKLNPGIDWSAVTAGTVIKIPDVTYPEPDDKAAFIIIHLSARYLEAFGTQSNLLVHFPCSIAAKVEKRPVGELHVSAVAPNPNYTFNPETFPESPEAQAIGHKLILPPGPKNPVGVAWIGLDRPGYGMHGTPSPEQIGRTESHGCFRMANWDAEYLVKLVWVGMPVYVEE